MCVVLFSVILKAFHSLLKILLLSVYQIFDQTLKNEVFLWVRQLGLIRYLVIFLCLFRNYLSVSKLNFLLIFLLLLINFKSFFSIWMVLAPLYTPTLSSLNLCCIAFSFSHTHVLLLTNYHNINFFVLKCLSQLVNFFNSFHCTIVLGNI